MFKQFHVRSLFALAWLSLSAAVWADEAGKVVLSVGEVRVQGQPVKAGHSVQAGDRLSTGADGYVYIKTVDNGFLILRPNSDASIIAYQADSHTPANSRFKFELREGVARSISGQAVKNAKQNFRFNTPVAAIGVRGTDFTVFTDAQTTRIAVLSGGVVVSGFGQGCAPEGGGPCETPYSRELFANQQRDGVLQVSRGQLAPELLRGKALSPDATTPPLPDESGKLKSSGRHNASEANADTTSLAPLKLAELDKVSSLIPQTPAPAPQQPAAIAWGRWQGVAEQGANLNLAELMKQDYRVSVLTGDYVLLRHQSANWQVPYGGAEFGLQGSMAQVQRDGVSQLANVENARLWVDFERSRFGTRFDLTAANLRVGLQAQGNVGSDGTFSNPSQYLDGNNMVVQGVMANGALGKVFAGYTFQSRLDANTVASGVTLWGSK